MKIGSVVGLLAVVVLGTNVLAVSRIDDMREHQERIYEENLQPLNALSAVQRATAAHRARVLEYAVSDQARRVELLGEMDEKQADVDAALAEYEPFVINQAAIEKYLGAREAFLASNASELFPAADRGDFRPSPRLPRGVQPAADRHRRRPGGGGHRPVRGGGGAQRRGRRRGRLGHHHAAGHRADRDRPGDR